MNILQLFHRLVYAQVLLGITASCMAERNPGLLLAAGAVGAMSWYVTEGPRSRTIPRWAVNAGALGAVAVLAFELTTRRADVVAAMGHFTMALQLLMLYARKSDREYAQLLVLSLLQMIGASVLSVSMIYGVFLAAYCVLALATALLFHLSASAERVHQANRRAAAGGPAPPRPATVAGPAARRHLRRLGLVIAAVSGGVAVAVFLAVPRTGKTSLDLGGATSGAAPQAGFTETVRLGAGPIGSGSREPLLNLTVRSRGQNIGWENDPWLVRGAALDAYDTQNHTWYRSPFALASDRVFDVRQFGRTPHDDVAPPPDPGNRYTAEIALRDTRQRVLFGVVATPMRLGSSGFHLLGFGSDGLGAFALSPIDQQMRATDPILGPLTYQIDWPVTRPHAARRDGIGRPPGIDELDPDLTATALGRPPAADPRTPSPAAPPARDHADGRRVIDRQNYARLWEVEPPRYRRLAQTVLRQAGLERDPEARHTPDDLRAAAALADHLRRRYAYDLDNPPARAGADPTSVFLFESRRGHCELFAAALVGLCRSVGIPARMVTGFHAGEFNTLGGYYVVRPTHAHAWAEVDAGPGVGWVTLDPTPGDEVRAIHRTPDGLLAGLRQAYEHVEFAWIRLVVAFDQRTRQDVLQSVGQTFRETRRGGAQRLDDLIAAVRRLPALGLRRPEALVMLLCAAGLLLAGFVAARQVLARRRRLARLRIDRLPAAERRGLGRRLGFYLRMLDLLERHGYRRPAWQSPAAFAAELAEANPLRFDPVVALTDTFYEVRYGDRPLDPERRQRVRAHLKQLEASFGRTTG
ncbi:MAG: transglutaminaseTgpA domain-containing protein [Planctomycetota bacterium]